MQSYVTYQMKNYIRSLLFIPPMTLYVIWIIVQYTYGNVDILSSYSNSSIILYIIATWITMNIFQMEEKAEKHILLMHLQQTEHFLYGKWIAGVAMTLPLIMVAHFYPLIMKSFNAEVNVYQHFLALYSHIGLVLLGILTGSFFTAANSIKAKYVWLLIAVTIALSLAYSQLADLLPKALSWILWILPPLRYFYEPLKEDVINGLPSGFLASFSFAIFYMIIAAIIILKMFMKHDK